MSRPKFHGLKVKEIRRETDDCVSVAFEVPSELKDNYTFVPGQYLTLRANIDGQDLRRSYSICAAPDENELRIAVKMVEHGIFSSWVNHSLKSGDEIQVMTPTGNFTTPVVSGEEKNYLFVAAGSGITPVISIIKSILKMNTSAEVNLIYGNRFFNTIIFREELENLKDKFLGRFRVFHVLSGEPNEIPMFHGRINHEKLNLFSGTFVDFSSLNEVFVCGPGEMIELVRNFSMEKGLQAEQIHFELFFTPGAESKAISEKSDAGIQKKADEQICQVSVIYDGQQTDFTMPYNGIAVLDAAQKQGLDIPFSCKGGMCCTCRAKVVEGSVEMDANYALEPGEVEAGFVLTCQSHPRSERLIVDFDRNN